MFWFSKPTIVYKFHLFFSTNCWYQAPSVLSNFM